MCKSELLDTSQDCVAKTAGGQTILMASSLFPLPDCTVRQLSTIFQLAKSIATTSERRKLASYNTAINAVSRLPLTDLSRAQTWNKACTSPMLKTLPVNNLYPVLRSIAMLFTNFTVAHKAYAADSPPYASAASPRLSYLAVVTGLAWPANFCTVLMSVPLSNKLLINVRRKSWGEKDVRFASLPRCCKISNIVAWSVIRRASSLPPCNRALWILNHRI